LFGEGVTLIAAGDKYNGYETRLLRINASGTLDTLPWSSPYNTRQSIWFGGLPKAYTCGGGVYSNNGTGWTYVPVVSTAYTNCIRGTAENNIFVAGDYGLVAHFNGVTWKVYSELAVADSYESVAVKDNLVIAVGYSGTQAVIAVGKR
jgi:hypothetical protein